MPSVEWPPSRDTFWCATSMLKRPATTISLQQCHQTIGYDLLDSATFMTDMSRPARREYGVSGTLSMYVLVLLAAIER